MKYRGGELLATKDDILIVFTDEVGSTTHQETMTPEEVKVTALAHFKRIIQCLEGTRAKIIKNIGDSLLITYEEGLIEIISSLAKAHQEGSTKIRIAAHFVKKEQLLQGQQVMDVLKGESEVNKLTDVWPDFASLTYDIFGHGVNLAARFSGIPKADLFIISDSVYEEIIKVGKEKNLIEKSLPPQNLPFAFITQLREYRVSISPPIPIVSLKGLKKITYLQPRYVCEVVKIDNDEFPKFHLYSDQKVLRNINIVRFHSDVTMGIESRLSKLRWEFVENKILQRSLETNPALPHPNTFYNDLCFEIYGRWEFNVKDAEKEVRNYQKLVKNIKEYNHPKHGDVYSFAIFNSFPNESSEEKYREFLDIKYTEKKGFYTMIRTYRVWKDNVFLDNFIKDMPSDGITRPSIGKGVSPIAADINRNYFKNAIFSKTTRTEESPHKDFFVLIIFQISPGDTHDVTSFEDVFKGVPFTLETIGGHLASFGLLRGEPDGYILYWLKQNTLLYDEIIDAILKECINPPSFIKKKMTKFALYFLRLLYFDEYTRMNIKNLCELSKKELSKCQNLK